MKNIFEETYEKIAELKKEFDAADDAGKESLRATYRTLEGGIVELGNTAVRIW